MKAGNPFLLFLIVLCNCSSPVPVADNRPKVIVLTDINNAGGDPDDKQSWLHLLWYANELNLRAIVPDYWRGKGYEATMQGLEAYQADFEAIGMAAKGYPHPDTIRHRVAIDSSAAIQMIYQESMSADHIYVLIWGQMKTFTKALQQHPEIANKVRVLTIGTGRKYGPKDEVAGENCNVSNWNGGGRKAIYEDPRFNQMWWLENNWTYNGMFMGEEPKAMLQNLSRYGAMGAHMKTVVKEKAWAQYFRVGDTPTVLYLIDPDNKLDDPTLGSWAGRFTKPFPEEKPHYYTDDSGPVEWDYEEPCNTWANVKQMYAYNKSTLHQRREKMYESLLQKLDKLYDRN